MTQFGNFQEVSRGNGGKGDKEPLENSLPYCEAKEGDCFARNCVPLHKTAQPTGNKLLFFSLSPSFPCSSSWEKRKQGAQKAEEESRPPFPHFFSLLPPPLVFLKEALDLSEEEGKQQKKVLPPLLIHHLYLQVYSN